MMKIAMFFMFALLLVSCNAVRVNYDYDKDTNFSNYTTYNYYPDVVTGLSDLDNKRLFTAVDQVLATKGILLSEEPDFLVNIQGRSTQMPRNNNVGVGLGGGRGGLGGGISMGIPVGQPNTEMELQFDFVDAQKRALFWQGTSRGSFNENLAPASREQKFKEIVGKVFSKYPPKVKK